MWNKDNLGRDWMPEGGERFGSREWGNGSQLFKINTLEAESLSMTSLMTEEHVSLAAMHFEHAQCDVFQEEFGEKKQELFSHIENRF